jgi:glycosyltransferase involved in cell wall biosynthesis
MIGVVIPAHNEAMFIERCLRSVQKAAAHPALLGEPVTVLVILDACTDATGSIAEQCGALTLAVDHHNVGQSRGAGAEMLLSAGARWLAFTDADSQVKANWLSCQTAFGADAVCGVVDVDDWTPHPPSVRLRYEARYQAIEGHRHIHGANLGVCAIAYRKAGGFRPLAAHEDVHLVQDLERNGARIIWTATNSVTTSARIDPRCREGFGEHLHSLA